MIRIVIAFAIVMGISLLFQILLKARSGDCWVLTVSLITLFMFILGKMHLWKLALPGFGLLAGIGYVITVLYIMFNRKKAIVQILSPMTIAMVILGLSGVILFKGAFWHLEEEFNLYGSQVRLLFEEGGLFHGASYSGMTLWMLFFEKITGLQDRVMYMAMFFLTSIGFLLPMQRLTWKDWKKGLVYLGIVYASVYSLFEQGFYSLYPELTAAAWMGGLLLMNQDRRQTKSGQNSAMSYGIVDYLTLVAGCAFLLVFQVNIGLLAMIAVLSYVLYKDYLSDRFRKYPLWIHFLAMAVLLILLLIIATILVNVLGLNNCFLYQFLRHKMSLASSGRFISVLFGAALGKNSRLNLGFLPFLFAISVAWGLISLWDKEEDGKILAIAYAWIYSFFYVICAFIICHMSSEGYVIDTVGLVRLFSLPAIAFFMMMLVELIFVKERAFKGLSIYAALFVLLFFLSGWNGSVLAYSSSLDREGTENYEAMENAKDMFRKMDKKVKEDDKILVMSQSEDSYIAEAMARYYYGDRVSDYEKDIWMIEEGGYYRGHLFHKEKAFSYKEYLLNSDFDYVLIVQTDNYISDTNKALLEDEVMERIIKAVLYKITR